MFKGKICSMLMQPMLHLSLWPPLWLRFYIYTLLMCTNTRLIETE